MRNRIFSHAANHSPFSTSSISSPFKKEGYSSGLWWDSADFALTLGFGIFALNHIIKDCKNKRVTKQDAEQTGKDEVISELAENKLAEIKKLAIEGCEPVTRLTRALRRHG